MIKVGVTGGIGSGKTTVSKIFEILGVPVFYADSVAREVMNNDILLIESIKKAFGDEAYSEHQLNRKYLAGIVFNNELQLAKLNSLVHPAVFRAFDSWAELQSDASYVLKEAALLFESGSYLQNDYNILVTAPEELRIKRVMLRDDISANEVKARIDKQLNDQEKEKLADHVLKNDEHELLIPMILNLHQHFLSLAY